jgi:hypothetical protein
VAGFKTKIGRVLIETTLRDGRKQVIAVSQAGWASRHVG